MPSIRDYQNLVHLEQATLSTGVTLNYAEMPGALVSPTIFLHGLADSWKSFLLVYPLLSKTLRVLAPDFRGHGDSAKPECCYTIEVLAEDVIAFMDALGLVRVNIVGHSMGSFVGQLVASRFPGRVERLILIGSAPSTTHNAAILELKRLIDQLAAPIDRGFVEDFQETSGPVPKEFMEIIISESMKVPAPTWKSLAKDLVELDHRPILGQICAPTLIVWGRQDGIFGKKDQELLQTAISNSILKEYVGGHNIHWEKPAEFTADLEEFLRGSS